MSSLLEMLSSQEISIHALREEGDPHFPAFGGRQGKISIHALREEGDLYRFIADSRVE